MDLHSDAMKAMEFPPKEDKRDFGDIDEERSTKEEDILASLLEDMGMDGDFWNYKVKKLEVKDFILNKKILSKSISYLYI